MRRFLILPLVLVATSLAAQTYTTIPNLEFTKILGKSFRLDLRIPDGTGPFPVILYLHSGAWVEGDRTGGPAIREATRGYAVASIDYPLAPLFIWPSQLDACEAAVQWLRDHAAEYHLDVSQICAFGTSAGGHLAAMLGVHHDVEAVIDFYGPTDLLKIEEQKLPCYPGLDANASYMPPSLLMGCPIQQCKDKTETANPITYVAPDDPPFLIMQGTADCLNPWQQSVMLHDALRAAGVDTTLVLVQGAQHADPVFKSPAYEQIVDAWLDARFHPSPVRSRRHAVRP